MQTKRKGFKLRDGRIKDKKLCFNVLRDGDDTICKLIPSLTHTEISEFLYLYFEEVRKVIIEEELGFEMPETIGYILVSGIHETAYKLGEASRKLNKAVVQPNYHTDGYVYKGWYKYTNNDNIVKKRIGVYPNAFMYKFKSNARLKKDITNTIKAGNFKHWGRFKNRYVLMAGTEKKENKLT